MLPSQRQTGLCDADSAPEIPATHHPLDILQVSYLFQYPSGLQVRLTMMQFTLKVD